MTDSFHGSCLAILFEKQFYAISNPGRGADRFESLMQDFGLFVNYVGSPDEIRERELPGQIDYGKVYEKLSEKRAASMEWLRKAVCQPEPQHSVVDKKVKLYPLRMMKSILRYYRAESRILKKILKR